MNNYFKQLGKCLTAFPILIAVALLLVIMAFVIPIFALFGRGEKAVTFTDRTIEDIHS